MSESRNASLASKRTMFEVAAPIDAAAARATAPIDAASCGTTAGTRLSSRVLCEAGASTTAGTRLLRLDASAYAAPTIPSGRR